MGNPVVTSVVKGAQNLLAGAAELAPAVTSTAVRAETADATAEAAAELLRLTGTGARATRGVAGVGDAFTAPGSVPLAPLQSPIFETTQEIIGELRQANISFMQGIRDEAGLQKVFEPGAWRAMTDFLRTNENPGELRKFMTDLLGGRARPTAVGTANQSGLITAEDVQAAVRNAPAAGVLAQAAQVLKGIRRETVLGGTTRGPVGESLEIANLTKAFGTKGITNEQSEQLRDAAKVIADVADQHPAIARAIADTLADGVKNDPANVPALLERARALAQGVQDRARALAGADPARQADVARRFMTASADDAPRILDPSLPAAAPARPPPRPTPTSFPDTGPNVPDSLQQLLPEASRGRLLGLSDAVRTAIGRVNGWARLQTLAERDPDMARAVASELNRNDPVATLHAADWLAERLAKATGPERDALRNDIAMGSFYTEAVPNIVSRQIAAGVPPAQALQQLASLMPGISSEGRMLLNQGLTGGVTFPSSLGRAQVADLQRAYRDAHAIWWRQVTQ